MTPAITPTPIITTTPLVTAVVQPGAAALVTCPDDSCRVEVSAGAQPEAAELHLWAPPLPTIASDQVVPIKAIRIELRTPDGRPQQPTRPVRVVMRYTTDQLQQLNVNASFLAIYSGAPDTGWTRWPSQVDRDQREVTGWVAHFSIVILAGPREGALARVAYLPIAVRSLGP